MTILPPAYQILLASIVLIAAVFDIRYRRIPNWLVLTGILFGFLLNTFLFGGTGAAASFLGGGLAFLIYFPLFVIRGMGAGDVKLMMAVGFVVGPANWLGILFSTAVLGGLFAVILLLRWGQLAQTMHNLLFILGQLMQFKAPYKERSDLDIHSPRAITLPHGATIAAGSLAFLIAPMLH
jgi:prepilin peptidase CpaA